MAVITPQTDVYLLKVPLEINDINQLTFANATAQYNYFNSLPKLSVDDFTYQRKDGTIRYGANFDDIMQYNYVMYRNDAFSNKWFYAFITNMQYINDNVTGISIKTDVWQTWQFDLVYKKTFIEREHVNNDGVGLHTLPESLQLGEMMINSTTPVYPSGATTTSTGETISGIDLYTVIYFQVTEFLSAYLPEATGFSNNAYNGLFSGLYFFACENVSDAKLMIQQYASAGKSDAIVSIFQAPKHFLQGSYKVGSTPTIYLPANNVSVQTLTSEKTINLPSKLNGYTPKNNKLFTYPYNYLYVTNNVGGDTTFNYEDFYNNTAKFNIKGSLSQGCAIKLVPKGYKNSGSDKDAFEYGLTGSKYPTCAWASDYYTNWMAQNGGNINTGVLTGIATRAIGYENANLFNNTLGMAGNVIGMGATILNTMAEVERAKIIPDQEKGNTNASDILLGTVSPSGTKVYYTVNNMCVRAEIAKIIDDYFSMFGYKVNEVNTPNVTGRRNWNYVKTIGCYIDGNVPQDDMQEIKSMFDRGITFWHNPATFADYSQNNDII